MVPAAFWEEEQERRDEGRNNALQLRPWFKIPTILTS
jgi:hypothetical protein